MMEGRDITQMYIESKYPFFSFSIVLCVVFFISLNIAWLNPSPGEVPFKPFEKISVAWQYNGDVPNMIASSAFFPEYFKLHTCRVNRPIYLALGHYLGNLMYKPVAYLLRLESKPKELFWALPVKNRETMIFLAYNNRSIKTYYFCISVALFTVNVLMALGILCFGYQILKRYIPLDYLSFTVFTMVTTPFVLFNAAVIHTNLAHLFNAFCLLFLIHNYLARPAFIKIILYSLIGGLLMLIKQNYCNLLLAWLLMFFYKKYQYLLLSLILSFCPLLFWIGILRLNNISYSNFESARYGQGTWFLTESLRSVLSSIPTIFSSFSFSLVRYYTLPVLILAGLGLWRIRLNKGLSIFVILALISCFLQMFISKWLANYTASDLSIVIFGLAWYEIVLLFRNTNILRKKSVLYIICLVWLIYNILRLTHFPLYAPV